MIYLASDGFQDQFGGPKARKFQRSNFRKLLVANHQLPIAGQKLLLHETITNWMQYPKSNGDVHEQIDDMLIIGVRF